MTLLSNVKSLRKIAPNFCGLLRKTELYMHAFVLQNLAARFRIICHLSCSPKVMFITCFYEFSIPTCKFSQIFQPIRLFLRKKAPTNKKTRLGEKRWNLVFWKLIMILRIRETIWWTGNSSLTWVMYHQRWFCPPHTALLLASVSHGCKLYVHN